ncbi:MAG: hypothetical protein IT479_06030 [Xanthomonadales bacterium]|nr:hypothetical protein [Xanthomonadales bacterium]MCC6592817.1 hypothetical protein [Xanthomonadales bacterium]MCE7931568.1 hypothetical protein [Xanthomonadales bacterium PRO6]
MQRLPLVLACSIALAACTPGVGVDVRRADDAAAPAPPATPIAAPVSMEPSPGLAPPVVASMAADLGGPFESAPTLASAELLPGFDLIGPGYRVAEQAPVVDYFGQFQLRSDVGALLAEGSQVLRLRVRELEAVRALDRVGYSEVFVGAARRSAERPVEAVRQVGAEPVDTASGLPAGIGRYLVRAARNLRELALDLNDVARDAMAGDQEAAPDGRPKKTTGERAQRIVTQATLRYIGYNKARRQIAREVGVDPYSTNPLLDERLDRLAWASWSGAKLTGLAIGMVGGVAGQLLGYARDAYELVWELPPEDLKRRNLQVLAELGITGKPARDLVRHGRAFTLTQQTEFVELLRLPLFAGARRPLFELARHADREVHARFLIDALRMLLHAARSESPQTYAVVVGTAPALQRADGSHIIALPVDHLYWTREIAAFAWRDDLIGRHNLLLVAGNLSTAALDAFSRAGWSVRERVDPHASDEETDAIDGAPTSSP